MFQGLSLERAVSGPVRLGGCCYAGRTKRPAAAFSPIARSWPFSFTVTWPAAGWGFPDFDLAARDEALVVEPVQKLAVVLRQPDDRRAVAGGQVRERRQLTVLRLLEVRVDRPAVRTAIGIAEALLDPLDHVFRERVPEEVGLDVRLGAACSP